MTRIDHTHFTKMRAKAGLVRLTAVGRFREVAAKSESNSEELATSAREDALATRSAAKLSVAPLPLTVDGAQPPLKDS